MNFTYKLQDLSLNVTLQNKSKIKHTYLRIISKNEIEIKANKYFTIYDAKDLLQSKEKWLYKHLKEFQNRKILEEDEFLYFGESLKKNEIHNIDEFYKKEILKILPSLVEKYSKLMNLYPSNIKFRKNKRTWGSCNHKNELNFNIYLCKFPLQVMEYVIIHELAHIKHKNHSKDFWSLVERFCPDYKKREELLKSFL